MDFMLGIDFYCTITINYFNLVHPLQLLCKKLSTETGRFLLSTSMQQIMFEYLET